MPFKYFKEEDFKAPTLDYHNINELECTIEQYDKLVDELNGLMNPDIEGGSFGRKLLEYRTDYKDEIIEVLYLLPRILYGIENDLIIKGIVNSSLVFPYAPYIRWEKWSVRVDKINNMKVVYFGERGE